jgi:hypothetical protein
MSHTEKLVTLKRLSVMLDAYGADPDRWLDEERSAALALIDTSAEARSLLDEAIALDGLLDRVDEPAVSSALTRKVHAIRPSAPGARLSDLVALVGGWLKPGSRAAWQGAVAAAAVIGIATGIGLSEMVFDEEAPSAIAVATTPAETIRTETPVMAVGDSAFDPESTMTTSLETNIARISLTGDDGANSEPLGQTDDSEMAVASIPLY